MQAMHIIHQDQAIHVFGIELRTSNDEAMQTIPPHWQRFSQEAVLANIPGKISDDVYAVYTHFDNAGSNNQGVYSLILGAQVHPHEKWQEIWRKNELPKTFIAEYERYTSQGDIDIFIGLEKEAAHA
jgi:predicted transcriptional regulator YdeE